MLMLHQIQRIEGEDRALREARRNRKLFYTRDKRLKRRAFHGQESDRLRKYVLKLKQPTARQYAVGCLIMETCTGHCGRKTDDNMR